MPLSLIPRLMQSPTHFVHYNYFSLSTSGNYKILLLIVTTKAKCYVTRLPCRAYLMCPVLPMPMSVSNIVQGCFPDDQDLQSHRSIYISNFMEYFFVLSTMYLWFNHSLLLLLYNCYSCLCHPRLNLGCLPFADQLPKYLIFFTCLNWVTCTRTLYIYIDR